MPTNTACADGGNAHPSGTVVTALGNELVVVDVVVVRTGIVLVVTTVVVVVVSPNATEGEEMKNAPAAHTQASRKRRICHTLVMIGSHKVTSVRRY
jgi:hypothetical protein